LRTNFKDKDVKTKQMSKTKSTLAAQGSVYKHGGTRATGHWGKSSRDSLWFERDFKKGPDYRPGPVTVIKFD